MLTFPVTEQITLGGRRRPEPPRDIRVQAGTQKAVVTWVSPVVIRGVDGYRVFVDDDNQLFDTINDPSTKKIEIPITASGNRFVAVSSFTRTGKTTLIESARIPAVATANSDKFVVTGTGGQTSGTSPASPPEYANEPGGGAIEREIL